MATPILSAPEVQAQKNDAGAGVLPVHILAATMFFMAAAGSTSVHIVQDTLKSGIASLGVLCGTLVFFLRPRTQVTPMLWHHGLWVPLGLMTYALLSAFWSNGYLAGVEAIRWLMISMLMWLSLNTLQPKNLPILLWAIHGGVCVASFWVALQFWFGFSLFPQAAGPASTFINKNFFAEYAISAIPFCAFLLFSLRRSIDRLIVAISLGLIVVAILMTGTRSALIALFICFGLMLYALVRLPDATGFFNWSRTERAKIFGVFGLVVGCLGLIPSNDPQIGKGMTPFGIAQARATSVVAVANGVDPSFSIRTELWKATARMIKANPWSGVGAGSVEVYLPLFQNVDTGQGIDAYAHNEFLQLLAEFGLPFGGFVIALALAWLVRAGLLALRREHQNPALGAFISIALVALFLVASVGFPIRLAACGALLGIGFGLLLQGGSHTTVIHVGPRLRTLFVTGVGAATLIAACVFGAAIYVESAYVRANELLVGASKARHDKAQLIGAAITELHKATELHPQYAKLMKPIATALVRLGEWPAALDVMEKLTTCRPYEPDQWFSVGVLRAKLGDYTGAAQALDKLELLQPGGARNASARADLYMRMGDSGRAEIELQKLSVAP